MLLHNTNRFFNGERDVRRNSFVGWYSPTAPQHTPHERSAFTRWMGMDECSLSATATLRDGCKGADVLLLCFNEGE